MATVKAFDRKTGAYLRHVCLPMDQARKIRDLWKLDDSLTVTMETWTL